MKSIAFINDQRCSKGAISLHEVEVRALGTIAGNPGGSAANTLLATFSSAVTGVAFSLTDLTASIVSTAFTGIFAGKITLETTNLPEDVKIRYRSTDPCGVAAWSEQDVAVGSDQVFGAISGTINNVAIKTETTWDGHISGWRVNDNGERIDLVNGVDTILFEVYRPKSASVISSIEMYVGQNMDDDNEGVSYVTGSNNNWFNAGAGFGDNIGQGGLLNAVNMRVSSEYFRVNKYAWAVANSFVGTDLGDDYEFRAQVKNGETGGLATQNSVVMPKMYGVYYLNVEQSSFGDTDAICLDGCYLQLESFIQHVGAPLPVGAPAEVIDPTTLESNLNGGAWSPTTLSAIDRICIPTTGASGALMVAGFRWQYRTPASFPWMETPPVEQIEIYNRRRGQDALIKQGKRIRAVNSDLPNRLTPIFELEVEFRIAQQAQYQEGEVTELNVWIGANDLVDPKVDGGFYYKNFGPGSTQQSFTLPITHPLKSEGWYRLKAQQVGYDTTTHVKVVNDESQYLFYFYSY